jgi:hypothetical protein
LSFDTNVAAASKSPLWLVEWDGDTVLSLDSTSGWSVQGAGANLATTTTCKEGAAGLTFDKNNSSTQGSIINSTLTPFDLDDAAYHAVWVYLPSLTDLVTFRVNIGQSDTDKYQWQFAAAGLVVGWNFLRCDINVQGANVTLVTQGSYSPTACDTVKFTYATGSAATTVTGIIVDWLTKHPYRYATGEITSPAASTKFGWMQVPYVGPNAERVQEGTLNVGSASVTIVDDGGATVIADMARFAFAGRTATIWQGFRGESEDPNVKTNWQPIYRGVTFAPQHLGKAWQFQINSLLEKLRRPVMQDATESSHVTLSGVDIITAWLRLALSTGNGTNDPTYDTLTAVRGAGIHQDFFDIDAIEALQTDWLSLDLCAFEFKEPVPDFLAWSFQEVFLAYGIVPVVRSDGRLSIEVARPPFGDDSTRTLDETNVITLLPQYTETLDDLYNQVTVHWDFDIATGTWPSFVRQGDSASQARYGVRDLAIKSKGINDSDTATRVAKRILARLGNGAPPIQLEALGSEQGAELGELVVIDHDAVPSTATGVYGISGKLAEVTSRGFNPQTGRTGMTLALASYQLGNYRRIGPASLTTNYDGSTAAQRARYCFIADTANTLGAANDPAHVIGPL